LEKSKKETVKKEEKKERRDEDEKEGEEKGEEEAEEKEKLKEEEEQQEEQEVGASRKPKIARVSPIYYCSTIYTETQCSTLHHTPTP